MIKKVFKNIIIAATIFVCLSSEFLYAKTNPFEGEVDAPSASSNNNYSEATIYSNNPYKEYSPVNQVPVGVDIDEYNLVDNYRIDFNTLELRIKYFSPTYTNIKQGAISSYYMVYLARGGNDTLQYNSKDYTSEIYDLMSTYKSMYEKYTKLRDALDKSDPDYATKYATYTAQIATYKYMYNVAKGTYDTTNKTINSTKLMLGLGTSLYNIGNVDNNNQITYARDEIVKNLKSAILSYLELKTYVSILENQTNLYYDMYKLYNENYALGLATENDVLSSFSNYESTKNTMITTKATMQSVKEQIAINLGYNLSDLDKLELVEPEVDFTYINSINFEEDRTRAYTSNSTYYGLSLSDKDKKYPGSTGEELLHKKQDYISAKVIAEFDDVYNQLQSAILSYEASTYLGTICENNRAANKRKLDNNLVTLLEYKGLMLQVLADELQVNSSKYSLIKASSEYYYAALGHLSIT